MGDSTEQRICIKFCFKIGKTATETYQLLQQAFSEDAVGRTQVFDWFCWFKEGRTSVESSARQHREMRKWLLKVEQSFTITGDWQYERSCDVCVNQFAENDWKNGGLATGSCTTIMRLHTLCVLCSSFWPPLSCSSHRTHQILHRVTFSYSQGLKKFWKDTDLRQRRTSNEIQWRHY